MLAASLAAAAALGQTSNLPLVSGSNALGARLVPLVKPTAKGAMISPASISLALGLAGMGARGQTEEELWAALGLKGMTRPQRLKALADLQALLVQGDPKAQMRPANSLWLSDSFPFRETYVREAKSFLDADANRIRFKDAGAAPRINRWVADSTNGKITKLFERLEPDTVAVLVNAIWFKGDWSAPFQKEDTSPVDFRLATGKKVSVPAMNDTRRITYGESSFGRWVSLPYGSGRYSMIVGLPKEGTKPSAALAQAATADLKGRSQLVSLTLPKWEARLRWEDMTGALKKLNVKLLFDEKKADMTRLTPANGYVSQVIHESFIKVDEKGTEASAATGVIVMPTSAPMPQDPVEFKVDRPFFYLIRDSRTGLAAFMGWVDNPKG